MTKLYNTPSNWPMFCSRDGSYGDAEEILIFEHGDFSERQWEIIDGLGDYDRYRYVWAVLNDDEEEIAEYEGTND